MTATYVEAGCTVEHEGRTFEAGGAVVTPERIFAYCGPDRVLTDWHGSPLGTWRTVASWPVFSYMGSRMCQIEARVDGVTYTGRGFGEGLCYRGRRKAVQA